MSQTNNVLIVGGSSGVGLATAKLALSNLNGSNVIIASSTESKCKDAVKELKTGTKREDAIIDYLTCDVSNFDTQYDDVETILKAATKRFGGLIDHVVWTAGRVPKPPSGEKKPSNADVLGGAIDRLLAPLALGVFAKTYMTDDSRSSITLTSGILVYKPRPGMGRMIAAAGGLESGTRGLAVDLAPIRVNFIVLGAIDTPLLTAAVGGNTGILDKYAEGTLVKRIGTSDEAAEAYVFCMRCSFMTGSRIDVEGGALLA